MSEERKKRLEKVAKQRQADLTVVFEDLHDPHNVMAMVRTCDAFGIQKVHLVFEQEKPFNPLKVGKASSSTANKWLDYETHNSTEECLKQLKNDGYELCATALVARADSLYKTSFLNKKIALLIGNEYKGLSEKAINLADKRIYLPMRGVIQSLNVSVASGIFLYEITRQRMSAGKMPQMSEGEMKRLLEDFSKR